MSEGTELAKQAQNLGQVTKGDHIESMIKAAVSAVPIVGGSIASLIGDYIPASRQKRLEEFTEDLAKELTALSANLQESYVKTDEFAYLFTRVYQNVTREYQQGKLEAYKNILVHALLPNNVAATSVERYLSLVEQLTATHLYVLSAFDDRRVAEYFRANPNRLTGSIKQTLQMLLVGLSEEDIRHCVFDLDQMGITNSVSTALATTITTHGAMQLQSRLTPFGSGFVNFIRRH